MLEQGLGSALAPPAASIGACRAQCALGTHHVRGQRALTWPVSKWGLLASELQVSLESGAPQGLPFGAHGSGGLSCRNRSWIRAHTLSLTLFAPGIQSAYQSVPARRRLARCRQPRQRTARLVPEAYHWRRRLGRSRQRESS